MTEAPPQEQATEEEIASAIALILAGGVTLPSGTTPLAAIAALLSLLPSLGDFAEDEPGGSVANAVARLVVEDAPEVSRPAEGLTGSLRRAQLDNLSYRAHYAIQAMRRISGAVVEGDDLRGALKSEGRYLTQHLEASRRRVAGAKMIDAAVELHGPVLGWKHGHPNEPRPNHADADGANFEAGSVPTSTQALPGVLPGCTCTVVAPYPGGRMLT